MYPDPCHDIADQTRPEIQISPQHLTMGHFRQHTGGDCRLRSDQGRNNFHNYYLFSPSHSRPPVDQQARTPTLDHYQGSMTGENTTYHRLQSDPNPIHHTTYYPDMRRSQARLTNAMPFSSGYQGPSHPFQTFYCSRYPHPSTSEQPDMGRSEPCYTQYRDLPSQCHPVRPAYSFKGTGRPASMVAENQPYQNDYQYPQHEPVKYESYHRGAKRVKLMLTVNNCSLSSISGPQSNEGPIRSTRREAKVSKHLKQTQPSLHRQPQGHAEPLTIESEQSSCNQADCNPGPDVRPLAACQIPEIPDQNPANHNPDHAVSAIAIYNQPKPPNNSPADHNHGPSVCTLTACVKQEPPDQDLVDHNHDPRVYTFTVCKKPKHPDPTPADHNPSSNVCNFTTCVKPKPPGQNSADHNHDPSVCTFTACENPPDKNSADHNPSPNVCAFTACKKPKPPDQNPADHNPKPLDQDPADHNRDPYVCILAACGKPKPPEQYPTVISPSPNGHISVAYREQRSPDQIPLPPFWNYQFSDMMWLKRARYKHLQ